MNVPLFILGMALHVGAYVAIGRGYRRCTKGLESRFGMDAEGPRWQDLSAIHKTTADYVIGIVSAIVGASFIIVSAQGGK